MSDGAVRRDGGRDAGASDAGAADAGVPPLGVEAFKDALAADLCRLFVECEAKMGLTIAAFEAVVCHPYGAERYYDAIDVAIAAGTVTYDEDAARACLTEVEATSCADLFSMTEEALTGLCPEAFVATVAPGEDCGRTAECVDGNCSISNTCPGTCIAQGDADDPCADDSECIASLACRPVGSAGARSCQTPGILSDACTTDRGCAGALVCLGGECETRRALNAACNSNTECADALVCVPELSGGRTCQIGAAATETCEADSPCALGLRCHPTSGVCIPLSQAGGACSANEQCPVGRWCDGGTCEPLPGPGESCVFSPEATCLPGNCVAGICELQEENESCRQLFAPYDDCEAGFVCIAGLCREPPPLGTTGCSLVAGSCGPDASCVMGLAGGTSCVPTACAPAP